MNAQRGQRIVRRADRVFMHARALAFMLACMLALEAVMSAASLADGGIVVWTGERMGARAAVIIAPAAPSVGEVEFAWIGAWKAGALVHAQHLDGFAIEGVLAPAPIGSEIRCSLALTKVGHWDITIDPDGNGDAQAARFPLEVSDPPARWTTLWPAMFAWIALVAIGLTAAWRKTTRRDS